jgi:hypothetical protein
MWSDLRKDIEEARRKLCIPDTDFSPLPFITNWHQLEERIYKTFCKIEGKSRPSWLWERYKTNGTGLRSKTVQMTFSTNLFQLLKLSGLWRIMETTFFFIKVT